MGAPKGKPRKSPTPPAPAAPAAAPAALEPRDGPQHRPEFITCTAQAVIVRPKRMRPFAPAAQSITADTHDPGDTVPCAFTLGGACNTGGQSITIRVAFFEPKTMMTQEIGVFTATCVSGRWSCPIDLTGMNLPAGAKIFIDVQIDRVDFNDPFINAYFNLYTGPC